MDRLYLKTFNRVRQACVALTWMYGDAFIGWLGLRSLFFDRIWWLALLNAAAFYWFLPLLVLLAAGEPDEHYFGGVFVLVWRSVFADLAPGRERTYG